MTDETNKRETEDAARENETGAPKVDAANDDVTGEEAAFDTASETGADPAAETAADEALTAALAENADLKDRFMRAAAEMENLRRRTEREVKDARSYAVTGFARDMLSVSDNLRRALEAVPQEMRENADEALKTLLDGVEMTERDMLSALERHGVKRIEPEGQKFDPNFHQAMFEVPNESVPNGTVVQIVQAGYVIGERVLRPAMVGVSRGGPKPEPAAKQNASAADGAEPGGPNAEAERDA
ncbi:nucleotide exchange factor GrpE [Pararhizobium mangrovi]|uniref:Protein GrpE n=1 Tax=Pararhizobium mangrovi TaxID=2590452 RepID=A0A506U6A0_9HYPH|nr:nucleotide exchange factor GrpE [Pararhizobium mangrovi]TPW27447.1 nucleotide exchange factor GrpE [Pararhizobium mangrovi]